NGQTFASFSLSDDSIIDLDPTSLTFNGLGTIAIGKTLTILNYDPLVSPGYAIRFLGDFTASAAFLGLMGNTTVNGLATRFNFDGIFTDVRAVPEPSSLVLCGCGVLSFWLVARRRLNVTAKRRGAK